MRRAFAIVSGERVVKTVQAYNAYDALSEMMAHLGARRDEFITLGPDRVAWRGLTFRAAPADAVE